uniref:Uncharacterized protein n=1 Tax=Brassica campestris TaxID=3711 RepID=M4FCM1_BRACM
MNIRRGGDLMGVDMLLIDSQATMMPETINVNSWVVCLLRWVMTKLHNMRAYEAGHLLSILCVDYLFIQSHSSNLAQAGDGVNPEETEAPPFVKDMEGKTYKLQGVDDGDNNHGGNSVPVKVEAAGSSNVDGAAGKVKKARKA